MGICYNIKSVKHRLIGPQSRLNSHRTGSICSPQSALNGLIGLIREDEG
ncbi:MAG: hypothetical protein WAO23_04560 [Dethiobacteria bacterium]